MTKTIHLSALAVLATIFTTAHAHGPTKCDPIPQDEWKPQMALQDKLKSEGWRVRQVKTWNGCYEVYGTDAAGARTEAFFNPKTFERVAAEEEQADKK